MSGEKAYDYIIIGAGSAGCTLANRLTEDSDTSVLVIEAGGKDKDPMIHIPLGWGKILQERRHDWMYFSENERHVDDRSIECARGKVLGGSSSINAMAYVRGHRGDYDRWAQKGAIGWDFANCLPYFKKAESWADGADEFRGSDGPLVVRHTLFDDPLTEAWFEAAVQAGYSITEDYNGAQNEGFGLLQQTIKNGKRCSAAVAYLKPAMSRPNLSVEINALVSRLTLDGLKATGVVYTQNGREVEVRANREVILSGGVINTPQVLMLSGIGPADELAEVGIEAVHDLKGVGKNLQDHFSADVQYERKTPGPFVKDMRFDHTAVNMMNAHFFGKGPATDLPSGFMAFIKTRVELDVPDIQFLIRAAPADAHLWFPGVKKAFTDAYSARPVLLHPESRGELRLKSTNPNDHVKIIQNFLDTEGDRRTIREGIKIAREIATQKALDPFRGKEILPGVDVTSDEGLDAHIRATSATAHHPCATCKMGVDDMAVVDPELRVHGMENLRVIDASVFPDLIGGNINAPTIMIAERAADMLRGRELLAPVEVSAAA